MRPASFMILTMSSWKLVCTTCSKELPLDHHGFRCSCGQPLDVRFQPSLDRENLRRSSTLWRYREVFPLEDDDAIVSLGEGMTPILHVQDEAFEPSKVFLKLEYIAPTGSFKDRGASVLMSRLKEMGIKEILEDSSGNAGSSLAAYAAAAGIGCRVLVPWNVPVAKAAQISSYGATLERIRGSRDDVAAEALRRSAECFYASHNWQPFFLQGTKSFAYEVAEQLDALPDAIFYPVGNGSLLLGSYKGFQEMKELGWISRIPHLVGVQAASHCPVYREVTGQRPPAGAEQTIAKGIAIHKPARLAEVAKAIRATSGTAVVVGDDEIRAAQRALARRGLLVEPTSAAAFAGLRLYREARRPGENERFLVPLTGSGLKDPDSLEELAGEPQPGGA